MPETIFTESAPPYQAAYPDGLATSPERRAMWATIREAEAAGAGIPRGISFEAAWKRALSYLVPAPPAELSVTVEDSLWVNPPRIEGYEPFFVARNGETATYTYRRKHA